jgi:hypothetical protein
MELRRSEQGTERRSKIIRSEEGGTPSGTQAVETTAGQDDHGRLHRARARRLLAKDGGNGAPRVRPAPSVPAGPLADWLRRLERYRPGDSILLAVDGPDGRELFLGRRGPLVAPASDGRAGTVMLTEAHSTGSTANRRDGRVSTNPQGLCITLKPDALPEIIEELDGYQTVKAFLSGLPERQRGLASRAIYGAQPDPIREITRLVEEARSAVEAIAGQLAKLSGDNLGPLTSAIDRIQGLLAAQSDEEVAALMGQTDLSIIVDRHHAIEEAARTELARLPGEPGLRRVRRELERLIEVQEDARFLTHLSTYSVDGLVRKWSARPVGSTPGDHPAREEASSVIRGSGPNAILAAAALVRARSNGAPQEEQRPIYVVADELAMSRWGDLFMGIIPVMRSPLGRTDPRPESEETGISRRLLRELRLFARLGRQQLTELTGRSWPAFPAGAEDLTLDSALKASPSRAETVLAYHAEWQRLLKDNGVVFVNEPVVGYAKEGEGAGTRAVIITESGRRLVTPLYVRASGLIGSKGANARIHPFFEGQEGAYRFLRRTTDVDRPSVRQELEATAAALIKGDAAPVQWVVSGAALGEPAVAQLIRSSPKRSIGIDGGRETALNAAIWALNLLPPKEQAKLTIHLYTRTPIEVTERPVGVHTYERALFAQGRREGWWVARTASSAERDAGQISKRTYDAFKRYVDQGRIVVHEGTDWTRSTHWDPEKGPVTLVSGPDGEQEISGLWISAIGYDAEESARDDRELAKAGLIALDASGKPIVEVGPRGGVYFAGPEKTTVASLEPTHARATLGEKTGVFKAPSESLAVEQLLGRGLVPRHHVLRASGQAVSELTDRERRLFELILDVLYDPELTARAGGEACPSLVYAGSLSEDSYEDLALGDLSVGPLLQELQQDREIDRRVLRALGVTTAAALTPQLGDALSRNLPKALNQLIAGASMAERREQKQLLRASFPRGIRPAPASGRGLLNSSTSVRADEERGRRFFILDQSLFRSCDLIKLPRGVLSDPGAWARRLESGALPTALKAKVEAVERFLRLNPDVRLDDVVAYVSERGTVMPEEAYERLFDRSSATRSLPYRLSDGDRDDGRAPLIFSVLEYVYAVRRLDGLLPAAEVAKAVQIDAEVLSAQQRIPNDILAVTLQ